MLNNVIEHPTAKNEKKQLFIFAKNGIKFGKNKKNPLFTHTQLNFFLIRGD